MKLPFACAPPEKPRPVVAVLVLLAPLCLDWNAIVAAQEPAPTTVVDVAAQPPEETPPPAIERLPELPETVVPGRLDAFPSEPLPADMVIAPNRQPTPLSQTGSAVEVITSEEIEEISPRNGQPTVAEVLRGRLGLDVVRQGGPGSVTSVFLRGANSQQTKVLLDGLPLNDPSNATRGFDFSTLSVDNLERIEILRGPQSMLYGSDAIGGVVNIITRRGEGPLSVKATGYGGSFNTGQTGLNVSGGDDVKYYSVTGSFFSTGGISAASRRVGGVEPDGLNLGTVSGRVGYNCGDNWNIDYVFRSIDSAAKIDDFDFFTALPIDNLQRKNLLDSFSNRVQISNWLLDGIVQHRVGFNLVDYDRRDTDPGAFGIPRFQGQTRQVDYFASAQVTETNILSAGADYLNENASTEGPFGVPLVSQNIQGVYVQDAFELGNFYGTAGVRWDEASSAGPAQTYRITGLYRIDCTGSAFHGTIGTGFRQPALAENSPGFFGNPDLLPERSKGWDIGMRQELACDALWVDATYFRNDFDDLIVFNPFSGPFGTLENVSQARASGVELTGGWELCDDWLVTASYTLDDTVRLSDEQPLLQGLPLFRRPRNKASASLTRFFPDHAARAIFFVNFVGERLDVGPPDPIFFLPTAVVLKPYVTLNIAANWQPSDWCELFLRFENVTNTEYEEANGFGTPGFGMYGGLTLVY